MRTYINSMLLILFALFSSGCIQSIYPYFTHEGAISFEEIDGYWNLIEKSDSKKTTQWIFTDDRIIISGSDDSTSTLCIKYFKVKDSILVNYSPCDFENFYEKKSSLYLIPGLISSHSLAKIDLQGDRMIIYPLDTNYVINAIKKKNYDLNFFEYGNSMAKAYIFVSESDNWVDFLNDNIQNESLFDETSKLVFEKIAWIKE